MPQPPPRRTSSSLPTHYRLPSTPTICLSSAWRSWRTSSASGGGSGSAAASETSPARGSGRSPGWSGYTGSKTRSSSEPWPSRISMSGGRASRCGPCTRPSTPSCRRSSRTRRTGPSSAISKPGCGWRLASSYSRTSSSCSSSTRAPAMSRSVRSRLTRSRPSSRTPRTPRTPGITSAPGL